MPSHTPNTSPTKKREQQVEAVRNFLKFLEAEKAAAENRVKECEKAINNPLLDVLDQSDLRLTLEAVRNNADEDMTQLLHLHTLVSRRAFAVSDAPPGETVSNMDKNKGSSTSREADDDILADFDPLEQDYSRSKSPEPLKQTNVGSDNLQAPSDLDFEVDENPSNLTAGGAEAMARLVIHNPSLSNDVARSLPVTVPIPQPEGGFVPNFPPEMDQDDDDVRRKGDVDIATSIANISKSLHPNDIGELPKPPKPPRDQ